MIAVLVHAGIARWRHRERDPAWWHRAGTTTLSHLDRPWPVARFPMTRWLADPAADSWFVEGHLPADWRIIQVFDVPASGPGAAVRRWDDLTRLTGVARAEWREAMGLHCPVFVSELDRAEIDAVQTRIADDFVPSMTAAHDERMDRYERENRND